MPADASSAEALYHQHRERAYRLCLRLGGGNISWAEDATHDVFVKLLERLPTLDQGADLGGWIYRVTMNTCMTRLKRERSIWGRVAQTLRGSPAGSSDTPERRVQLRQELAEALQALQALPPTERVVFSMKWLDGRSQREIGDTLRLSEGYVSKLLTRATQRLEQHGWELSHG